MDTPGLNNLTDQEAEDLLIVFQELRDRKYTHTKEDIVEFVDVVLKLMVGKAKASPHPLKDAPPMLPEYTMVVGNFSAPLSEKVSSLMRQGWSLYGPCSVIKNDHGGGLTFAQALVRNGSVRHLF